MSNQKQNNCSFTCGQSKFWQISTDIESLYSFYKICQLSVISFNIKFVIVKLKLENVEIKGNIGMK